jgi:hypothetical protein
MTCIADRKHRTRLLPLRVLIVSTVGAVALVSIQTIAQAASESGIAVTGRHADPGKPTSLASSICDKVSAASISSIIGYKVPAGTATVFKVKATKANFGISGTNTICTYGGASTMAALLKDVSLTYEVVSKPVTTSEIQKELQEASKGSVKYTFTTYSGLGVPGFYFSLTEAGITGQGISGVENGTHYFGASVESKSISKSALAALAKLAEKL